MNKIKICILGDICPTEDYRDIFDSKDSKQLFGESLKIIKNSDISICNFECPATDNKKELVKCGPNLKANPQDVKFLKESGIKFFSLANNHIKDFGVIGVRETIDLCKNEQISYVGAGNNLEEAKKPLIVKLKNKKIGILSFAEEEFNLASEEEAGANHFDLYTSYDEIEELKKNTDYVIILYHGGIEYYKYPSPLLQKKCRKMIEKGANIVLCQHSHCIGTHEDYKNGRILYGQGNSIYGYRKNHLTWNEGLIVCLEIGETVEIKYHLLNSKENGVELVREEIAEERLKKLEEESKSILNKNFIEEEWKKFVKKQEALYLPLLYGKGRILNKVNRVLNNKLMEFLLSKKNKMVTMNLIRCDAHQEVVRTILEDSIRGIKNDD